RLTNSKTLTRLRQSVNPVADPEAVVERLYVKVRGLLGARPGDELVDKLDDGRLARQVPKTIDVDVGGAIGSIHMVDSRGSPGAAIGSFERCDDVGRCSYFRDDAAACR